MISAAQALYLTTGDPVYIVTLTSNDLRSTALAALMFVYHQTLQVQQEAIQVLVPMVPEQTLASVKDTTVRLLAVYNRANGARMCVPVNTPLSAMSNYWQTITGQMVRTCACL
jgi:hypothetical protein